MKRSVLGICLGLLSVCGFAQAKDEIELPPPCEWLYKPAAAAPPGTGCPSGSFLNIRTQTTNDLDTWVSATWTRDRRPAAFIKFFDGRNYLENQRGLTPWWFQKASATSSVDLPLDNRSPNPNVDLPTDEDTATNSIRFDPNAGSNGIPDAIDGLIWEVKKRYNEGFRRFIIKLPSGVVTEEFLNGELVKQLQSINQWGAMAAYKQNEFLSTTGAWYQFRSGHVPGFTDEMKFEVYIGSSIGNGTCTPCTVQNTSSEIEFRNVQIAQNRFEFRWVEPCSGQSQVIPFDPRSRAHVDALMTAIAPWKQAGFTRIWMDNSNDNSQTNNNKKRRWSQLDLTHHPDLRQLGYQFGSENFPWVGEDIQQFEPCHVQWGPWFGLIESSAAGGTNFVMGPGAVGNRIPRHLLNRSLTEVMMTPRSLVDGSQPAWSFREFTRLRAHGFVLSTLGRDKMARIIQRQYSMGWIYQADFNGDNIVNILDLQDFNTAVTTSAGPIPIKAFSTGDIDGDGVIEGGVGQDDRVGFENIYNSHLNNYGPGTPPPPRVVNNQLTVGWANYGAPNDL